MASKTNFITADTTITVQPTAPAFEHLHVGSPCFVGLLPGIVVESLNEDNTVVMRPHGVFRLPVSPTNGSADAAVGVGDALYVVFTDDTPVSKTTTGQQIGFALEPVAVADGVKDILVVLKDSQTEGDSDSVFTPVVFSLRVPGAPFGLTTVSQSSSSISFTWSAPTDDGGSPITGYTVEHSFGADGPWQGTATTTNTAHEFTGLSADNQYYIRIRATNAVGSGPWYLDPTGSSTTT